MVGTFFLVLVNGVPVCSLHYSIVRALIDGVDVVANNEARFSVLLRMGPCALLMVLWRRC
jgi:ABC-type Na+ efflux pump permease subunit